MIHYPNNTYTGVDQIDRHAESIDKAIAYTHKKRLERIDRANKDYNIDLALCTGIILIVLIYIVVLA